MKILGIETSCDETSVAVVENGTTILSNIVSSSSGIQSQYGGVFPEIAAREQIKLIIPVLDKALKEAKTNLKDMDAIAVTIGPGLIGSLLVGIETARTIAFTLNKPIIPVNHVLAHVYANWLNPKLQPKFPALCLIVSGGHTDLLIMENHLKLKILGQTKDDAAGEAFDKTARLIGLPYPGGPEISAQADKFRIQNSEFRINFPRPMIGSRDFNFSFSGLKTAVLREYKKIPCFTKENLSAFAYEIQEAITDVLVSKTLKAAQEFKPKSILLAGGVSANSRLRNKIKLKIKNLKLKIDLFIPLPNLCTDNAAAIASYAFFNNKPKHWKEIQTVPSLHYSS